VPVTRADDEREWRARYAAVLRSARWKNMRLDLIKLTDGKCERCQASSADLQLHHLTYERLGAERRKDVQLLCFVCHKTADGEREVLQQLASGRRQTDAAFTTYLTTRYGHGHHPDEREWHEFNDWLERKREEGS
jgi:5-methylcytosine-specific restriction endonuclease McrA